MAKSSFKLHVDLNAYADFRRATIEHANEIVEDFQLTSVWEFFKKNNAANSLYYHNLLHTAWMICYVRNAITSAEFNGKIGPIEQAELILAAMFHDYNHTGGGYKDNENIKRAVLGMGASWHILCEEDRSFAVGKSFQAIERLITCTEYPFKREPKTPCQCILRDADILYGMTGHFEKIVMCDLFTELLMAKPTMTFDQFVEGQKVFHDNAVMYTSEGLSLKRDFIHDIRVGFYSRYDQWAMDSKFE